MDSFREVLQRFVAVFIQWIIPDEILISGTTVYCVEGVDSPPQFPSPSALLYNESSLPATAFPVGSLSVPHIASTVPEVPAVSDRFLSIPILHIDDPRLDTESVYPLCS